MDPIETYKRSFDLVKNHIIESLIYGVILYILGGLVFLIPIIGQLYFHIFILD